MTGPHTDRAALLAFVDDPTTLDPAEQLRLAQHLTKGCADCWAAVNRLPDIEPFRPSSVALREALLHLVCARSRAALASNHLVALARVRRPPFGFARLLLAETLIFGLAEKDGPAPRDPVVRDLVLWLAREGAPRTPELADLEAQLHIDECLLLLQEGDLETAAKTFVEGHAACLHGTHNADLLVNLGEVAGRFTWMLDDLDGAVASFSAALPLLGKGRGLARRFEIHGEIAVLHVLRNDFAECDRAEAAAREALEPLRRAPDPILATGAALREAQLALNLATVAVHRGVSRAQAVREAVAALRAKADDFERFTDTLTRACKDYCLARLLVFVNWGEAAEQLHRAAAAFRKCEADDRYEAAMSGIAGLHIVARVAEMGGRRLWTDAVNDEDLDEPPN